MRPEDRRRVTRFEDLIAWQKARALNKQVYLATLREPFARDFGLSRQIQRAVASIPSNIAEGFERRSPGEFHQALTVAKGSCGEVRTQLYLALDLGYLAEPEFEALMAQATEVARLVSALRASVARYRLTQRQSPDGPRA
jgi:four helix bundle protein